MCKFMSSCVCKNKILPKNVVQYKYLWWFQKIRNRRSDSHLVSLSIWNVSKCYLNYVLSPFSSNFLVSQIDPGPQISYWHGKNWFMMCTAFYYIPQKLWTRLPVSCKAFGLFFSIIHQCSFQKTTAFWMFF